MEPQPLNTSTTTTSRSFAPNLVHRVAWTLLSLCLISTLIIAIAWFVLNPHEPRFRVTTLSMSNFSVSDSQLKGRYEVELNISNPNSKVQVMVERFSLLLCYGSVGISGAVVMQTMYLEKKSEKDVKLRLKDSPIELAHKVVSEDLVKDWNKGIVNFDVKMMARITFEAGIWPTREKFMDINCDNLDVGFVPVKDTGKLLGIGKDCQVRS